MIYFLLSHLPFSCFFRFENHFAKMLQKDENEDENWLRYHKSNTQNLQINFVLFFLWRHMLLIKQHMHFKIFEKDFKVIPKFTFQIVPSQFSFNLKYWQIKWIYSFWDFELFFVFVLFLVNPLNCRVWYNFWCVELVGNSIGNIICDWWIFYVKSSS